MSSPPVEFVVIEFSGNQFDGQITDALTALTEANLIRVIDALLVVRDKHGSVAVVEVSALPDDRYEVWNPIVGNVRGLMAEADGRAVASAIRPGSSAALLLIEHRWAEPLSDAIDATHGRFILSEHIPRSVIRELETYLTPDA